MNDGSAGAQAAAMPTAEERVARLSSLRGFTGGTLWNLLGRGAPVLVAIAATPVLIGQLGVDRWALFALAISVVGTFGLLDLGISAALTRALAERIGTPQEARAPALAATGLALVLALGAAGGTAGFAAAPWCVDRLLHVPLALRPDTVLAFRILALSGPLVVANAALWGMLAAYQRFRAANLLGIPVGVLYYVAPMLMLAWRDSLAAAVFAVVAVRAVQTLLSAALVWRQVPELRGKARFEMREMRYLIGIGGWVTVSNTLAPLMTYADRFVVGALAPLAAVSHYVTPVDFVWRLTMLPIAVAGTLYPAVATGHRRMPDRVQTLLRAGSLVVVATMFPACAAMVGFGDRIMTLWLGARFAADSQAVLMIVGGGVFFSCLAALPATTLDGIGRPDIGAGLLVVQTVLFPPAVAAMTIAYGIEGAAVVWSVRAVTNCLVRLWVLGRVAGALRPAVRQVSWVAIAGGLALLACALTGPPGARLAVTLAAAAAIPCLAAHRLLDSQERDHLLRLLHVTRAREKLTRPIA